MAPFDRELTGKTLLFTAICTAIALVVGATTDEPSNGWPEALARCCALVPLTSGLGAALALSQSRSRGELLPLEALGIHPWRLTLPALLVAWSCALGAAAILASALPNPAALFPLIPEAPVWDLGRNEAFLPALGIHVAADGFVTKSTLLVGPVALGDQRALSLRGLSLVLPLAVLVPVWAVSRQPAVVRALSGSAALALQIAIFHAAALRVVSVWLVLAASLPLMLAIAWAARTFRAGAALPLSPS